MGLDYRRDIAIDELAAVIVHDSRFGVFDHFERRLQFERNDWPSRLISSLCCRWHR